MAILNVSSIRNAIVENYGVKQIYPKSTPRT